METASPALIERVRTAATDGTGLYRIVNLPPGLYTVTFTLPGFNQVRREAVQVEAGFTATIDADMRVGAVEETVTVTGESPVVDLQSAAQTRSVSAEMFKQLPSSGSWLQMAALMPAVRASIQDVGGILGDQTGAQVSAHGSRAEDGVSMLDGLRIGNMYQSSNLTNMSLSPLLFEQVDVQLAGQSGEAGTNGVIDERHPQVRGQHVQRQRARQRFRSESSGQQRDGPVAGTRAERRIDHAENAVRPERRRRRAHQARSTVVLRDIPVLHERVLHRRPLLPRRRRRRAA